MIGGKRPPMLSAVAAAVLGSVIGGRCDVKVLAIDHTYDDVQLLLKTDVVSIAR